MTFVTPVMEHWLEREIVQWVHHNGSIRRSMQNILILMSRSHDQTIKEPHMCVRVGYVYIYIHTCMYVCVCICMYVCVCKCVYVCMYACIDV